LPGRSALRRPGRHSDYASRTTLAPLRGWKNEVAQYTGPHVNSGGHAMNAQLKPGQAGDFRLLIGGQLVPGGAGTFDVINPATEEVFVACPRADLAQLNQAVAAAKAAFPA